MRQHADAARGEVHLSRIGLRVGDELLHRIHRERRVDDQEVRTLRHQNDRVIAGERIVAGILLQDGGKHESARARIEQRVTVRLGLGRFFGADCVAGPGAIVDHHGLPDGRGQIIANEPGDHVDRTAGRRRNDDFDRPRWINFGSAATSLPSERSNAARAAAKMRRPLICPPCFGVL